ncbi:CrcB family protein [Granulibacter bethesdensis]|nr:CrcB family protein [Granulibacter bethesdensis]
MMSYLIVFFGAGIGGMARHMVNLTAMRWGLTEFPFGTLFINMLGSFLIGAVVETFALKAGLPQHWRLFLTTGILGGFTTFSAFSLETALLYERGKVILAASYAVASVTLSVGALFLALHLVRTLIRG